MIRLSVRIESREMGLAMVFWFGILSGAFVFEKWRAFDTKLT